MSKISKLGTGSSKRFVLDSVSPILLIPLLVVISSINFYLTLLVIFLVLPALLCHIFLIFRFSLPKKKFFYVWSIVSMFFIFICFEILIVPLMVISPSENVLFYVLFCGVIFFTKRIQGNSSQNITKFGVYNKLQERKPFIGEKSSPCTGCSARGSISVSCRSCRNLMLDENHYNAWIDCSVGESNRNNYYVLLLISMVWLAYTSYIILTTICGSYLAFNKVLIPSDCNNVYATNRSAVCFVGVLYSVEIIAFISVTLMREFVHTAK
ncbi:palmitoyltransferase ZDHHC23-A [Planococcus citri]|uniref:palmitoyltransferase ZDHHC23-A n=1 Tax=Planococcus citri TaxID=170843 RepID=UPI0031F7D320